MAKKGVNKLPNHSITCRIFIPMDDKNTWKEFHNQSQILNNVI
jgi:hypothetical protein